MGRPGLDRDGFIVREGDLARVAPEFAPVVDAVKDGITAAFGSAGRGAGLPSAGLPGAGLHGAGLHSAGLHSAGLHSAYLYGSIPRGTAVAGVSDLDVLVVTQGEPTAADRTAVADLERALDARFPQINGVGVLLFSAARLVSELERYDFGWFVACLCTPLLGEDLGRRLPRYRPTALLARETNGDLGDELPGWRQRLAEADSDNERRALSRLAGRRIVRTGFTLVMPRWEGWTSDLDESAAVFGRYYPARLAQMRVAAAAGRIPTTSEPVLSMLINDLGPWLAAEYLRVHGQKTPRS